MSIDITFNGVEYSIPEFRDTNYANELTQFFVAIPNGALQPTAGLFTLLNEVDFGASFGVKSLYVKSRDSNPSTVGILRMGSAESIGWRNNAHGGNLLLTTNASDELLFNGAQVLTGAGPSSYVSSIAGTANQVIASGATGAVTLSLPQSIATSSTLQFGAIGLGAAVDATAILSLSSTVKGFLPPRMTTTQRDAIVTPAEGLTIYNTSTGQLNLYASGVWTALTMSAGGTVNAGTQYQLGYYAANGTAISGLTAITATKALVADANGLPVASTVTTTELQAIHGLTASRALASDGSGLISVATTSLTELNYVTGVTSAIQTQLNSKAPLSSPTFTGIASFANGTAANPSINLGDATTGFYRASLNELDWAIAGVQAGKVDNSGNLDNVLGNIRIRRDAAGADVVLQAFNSNNASGASTAKLELINGGTSAGDSWIQMLVTGSNSWSMGLDNSDSDAFVISASSALGTTNRMRIASDIQFLLNTNTIYTN